MGVDSRTGTQAHVSDRRPLQILVSPMGRLTRGYMLESAAREYRIWAFQEEEPTWGREFLCGSTTVDTLDAAAMIEAARDIPATAVLCWDETRILPAALLAEAYGLPAVPPDVIRVCRDKAATRRALDLAAAPQARARAVRDAREALSAAEHIGYPVILKPRALVGSNGTTLAESPERVREAFEDVAGRTMDEVRERFDEPVLVEEYLDGPEISVDSLCWDGEVTPLFVARKQLGFPPHFEEVGHCVDSADPLLRDTALRDALAVTHKGVGMTCGWTHTEWRLTDRGPRLVEINARSGGDLIPYLGRLTTGVDAGLVAADLAYGREPRAHAEPRGAAAIRFLYPPGDMVVESVEVDTAALPAAVDRVEVLAVPGQHLALPPASHVRCRYALVVVTAPTAEECALALDAAERAVTVTARPGGRESTAG